VANTFFFSDNDLKVRAAASAPTKDAAANDGAIRFDASGKAILNILRHTGRIRNASAVAKVTRYVICTPAATAV
jgi:hypothetical protein